MDNKQEQLDTYRRQLQELTEKINALSAESEAQTPVEPVQPQPQPPVQQYKPLNIVPPQVAQPKSKKVPSWMLNYAHPAQTQDNTAPGHQQSAPTDHNGAYTPPVQSKVPTPNKNIEGVIGRNLFAILASLLILVGISIFISSIYEYIPTAVKVLAIYAFGFAMLGVGAGLYSRNKNNFWLGVASCGLAELLICVIASYSYFDALNLSGVFILILIWIFSSLWLTKIHPVVFKIIGYMGFSISMWFGFSHLLGRDTGLFFGLLIFYTVLSGYFMLSNRQCVKTNTVIAFMNVVQLSMFVGITYFLPEGLTWLGIVIALTILSAYHIIYILGSKLVKNAYPFFAIVSSLVLSLFAIEQEMVLSVPILMLPLFVQWYICLKMDVKPELRVTHAVFSGFYLWVVSIIASICNVEIWYWYCVAVAAAYLLYYLTSKLDMAWLGFGCFIFLRFLVSDTMGIGVVACFLTSLLFFVLTNSKLLHRDNILQTAWYIMVLITFNGLYLQLLSAVPDSYEELYQLDDVFDGLYGLGHAVLNTIYLHLCLSRRPDKTKLSLKSILVMVIQGIILLGCTGLAASKNWIAAAMGIVSSLMIICYSLGYVYRTKAQNKDLLIWQFIKFSLYFFVVPNMMQCPNILIHIFLLVIAIVAIITGFRLDCKVVRTYGLILSLVDVGTLIFFNIDLSDSLQFSLGVVLCGLLCFAISFIYSKIAKSASDDNNPESSANCDTAETAE